VTLADRDDVAVALGGGVAVVDGVPVRVPDGDTVLEAVIEIDMVGVLEEVGVVVKVLV